MRLWKSTMVLMVVLGLVLTLFPGGVLASPDGDAIGGIVNPGDGNPPPSMWPNCWKCVYTYLFFPLVPLARHAECDHDTVENGERGPCVVVVTSHLTEDCWYEGGGLCSVPLQSITTYSELYDRPEVFQR